MTKRSDTVGQSLLSESRHHRGIEEGHGFQGILHREAGPQEQPPRLGQVRIEGTAPRIMSKCSAKTSRRRSCLGQKSDRVPPIISPPGLRGTSYPADDVPYALFVPRTEEPHDDAAGIRREFQRSRSMDTDMIKSR